MNSTHSKALTNYLWSSLKPNTGENIPIFSDFYTISGDYDIPTMRSLKNHDLFCDTRKDQKKWYFSYNAISGMIFKAIEQLSFMKIMKNELWHFCPFAQNR